MKQSDMTRYKYKVIYETNKSYEALLNEYGSKGWRLVQGDSIMNKSLTGIAIFERQVYSHKKLSEDE